ncbi:hypothetical protein UPYG_G00171330 [Umbra pygmaea]|uniref:Uncharacterized protein n=1 Tax=Umbra pygmaea TaxID=75934 RepID=A0ABD0WP23_UMBPY
MIPVIPQKLFYPFIRSKDPLIFTMPRSETWPGSIAMETMTVMDYAGSCDSVASMNSGFSDNSLDHLSIEEKACLMFLEETIDSLESEEDSGQSNNHPDRLPASSNVASKRAQLTASMAQNKLNNVSLYPGEDQAFMVPTPFILANSTSCTVPKARPGLAPDRDTCHPKLQVTDMDIRLCHGPHPHEVNVEVIPPSSKTEVFNGQKPRHSSRAPLSHEALVQLRKSASMKAHPQHPPAANRDPNKQSPVSVVPIQKLHGSTTIRPLVYPAQVTLPQEPGKACPPVVFPKPPNVPSHCTPRTQKCTSPSTTDSSAPSWVPSPNDRCLSDPQKVRKEALQKLGLLTENEFQTKPVTPLFSSKSHSCWDLSSPGQGFKAPAYGVLTSSQQTTTSQGSRGPNSRPLQSSSSFLRCSRPDVPLQHLAKPSGVKAATLEHSGVGLGRYMANNQKPPQDGCCCPPAPIKAPVQEKTTPVAQPVSPHKTHHCPDFSVVMVPNMGEDRREALRKLGLLKD